MTTPQRPTLKIVDLIDADNPSQGDLFMTNGVRLEWIDAGSVEAIAQKVRNRFEFFKGSWFLDRRKGTPYVQALFRRDVTESAKRQIVRQVIALTPGIRDVPKVILDYRSSDRSLNVTFEARTVDGTTLRSSDFAAPFIIPTPETPNA